MQTPTKSVKFLRLSGTLDSRQLAAIHQRLERLQLQPGDTVVLNLQHVEQMNSSGVGVLVLLLKQLQLVQVRLQLGYPSPSVLLALRMSGMLRSFAIASHGRTTRATTSAGLNATQGRSPDWTSPT